MIENAAKMLIVFLVIIFNIDADDAEKCMYCMVDIDSPGIILNSTIGKDMSYNPSEYLNSTKLPINLANSWNKISSKNNPRIEQMVLDQRWEGLNISNYQTLTDFIRNDTEFFVSLKTGHSLSWQHLRVMSINATHLQTKNNMTFEIITKTQLLDDMEDPKSLCKLHEYFYWHTTTATTTEIVRNCTNLKPQPRCIHLTVAMCEKCEITIEIKREERVLANGTFKSQSEGKWSRLKLCANNLTGCFGIFLTPKNCEGGFWALDDEVQVTSCQKNYRYLKWSLAREQNVTGCENSYNQNITNTFSADDFDSKTKCLPYKTEIEDSSPPTKAKIYYILIILAIIIIIIIAAVTFYFYCYKKKYTGKIVTLSELENSEEVELLKDDTYEAPTRFQRKEFIEYVQKTLSETETLINLEEEFKSFPTKLLKPHYQGLTEENIKKNEVTKVIPYDESRVKLQTNLGFTSYTTDYINASYVEGINGKKEYIVAQNPLPHTMTDFWYMIWQENISFIVMLSNRNEPDTLKYWPLPEKVKRFDNIELSLVQEKVYEYFLSRELKVHAYSQTRTIWQYHYDSWVDEGEYYFSSTLVPFMDTLLGIPHDNSAPVLIHCRGGTGRAGTLILIDAALRSSLSGTVDMVQITKKLRNCRAGLVENFKEYKLAHLVSIECFSYCDLSVAFNEDFENEIRKLAETETVRKNWEYMEKLRKRDNNLLTPFKEHGSRYTTRNRYSDILPFKHSRCLLKDASPDYINATLVDGYRKKDKFITTQQPLPQTLNDFWEMIFQKDVSTIVNLNELDVANGSIAYCEYFPTEVVGAMLTTQSKVNVKLVDLEKHKYYDLIKIEGLSPKNIQKNIVIINMKGWYKTSTVPTTQDAIYDVWKAMNDNLKEGCKTVICCDDGVTGSGLLVCYSYLMDKLHHEKRLDILAAVRAIRKSHSKYVRFEQFSFLYKCGITFNKRHCSS